MRQLVSTEQGHERLSKWQQPFVKRQQSRFARKGIADQHSDKIDHIVVAKAGAGETHPVLDCVEDSRMCENLRKGGHFSHPGRH
jgi:hypothetical protein